jgi:hypothetical protein
LEAISIEYLRFEGGATAYIRGGNAIIANYLAEFRLENCGINRFGDTALKILDGNEIMWIQDNDISLNYGNGIWINASNSNGVSNVWITRNHIWNNQGKGVLFNCSSLSSSLEEHIQDNSILYNGEDGICLLSVKNSIVSDNIVAANNQKNSTEYNGITLLGHCDSTSISGGRVFSNGNFEIYISSDWITIKDVNVIGGIRNGTIYCNPQTSHNIIEDNPGS